MNSPFTKQMAAWLIPMQQTVRDIRTASEQLTVEQKVSLLKEQRRLLKCAIDVTANETYLVGSPRLSSS
jgi:hypothetical protein